MAVSSTKHFKATTRLQGSRDANHTDNIFDVTYTDEYTYTRHVAHFEVLALTDATTIIDLSMFGTVDDVIMTNLDSTNFCDVEYDTTKGGVNIGNACPAGQTIRLGPVLVAGDLTFDADTAATEIVVTVIGD